MAFFAAAARPSEENRANPHASRINFASGRAQSHVGLTRMSDITPMLQSMSAGDERAAERLISFVYDELRALAAAKLARERPGHTLQPTALVHEAWLRLGGEAQPAWQNRRHFFAAAAEAMRRVLIENARRRHAARRGSAAPHVALDGTGLEVAAPVPDEDLIRLHEVLDRLAIEDSRKAELVKLRYFVGLSIKDVADVLGISKRSADREWAYARAWLGNELRQLRE
jgi:RNA polymerase sigma factor (TIGR02999 family)